MNKKRIYIVIGCDTDPDRVNFLPNVPTETLGWSGMLEGIPLTKEKVEDIKDSQGNSPVFSWCLRADHQIKEYYGNYNSILELHKPFFLELENSGDEIAWHPHFFKFDEQTQKWYQEFKNIKWQKSMLKNAHAEFLSTFPGRAKSVRMGWDYHNNDTFSTLNDLGVDIDFSGIPSLFIHPKNDSIKSVNFFDWSLSPNHPYYPATSDYRREAVGDERTFKMLEAPNFISQSLLWSLISGLVFAKKMKDVSQIFRALKKPVYWIGITGKTNLFAPIVNQIEGDLKKKDNIFFITYFHPDELIENNSSLYSLQYLYDNLKLLKAKANQLGADIHFIKASEIKTKFM